MDEAPMHPTWKRIPDQERGVLCGCDHQQEWLLPWWWDSYRAENTLPVLFCDFGMSEKTNKWCRERGEVVSISMDSIQIKPRQEIAKDLQEKWMQWKINWDARISWFKKPLALLESPFKKIVCLDLDCEVLSPIEKLFDYATEDTPLAMSLVDDTGFSGAHPFSHIYNGGVVVFLHGIEILPQYALWALEKNHEFFAEDLILSCLIDRTKMPVARLPIEWNWEPRYGINLYAHIFHWIRETKEILKMPGGGIRPRREAFERAALNCKITYKN